MESRLLLHPTIPNPSKYGLCRKDVIIMHVTPNVDIYILNMDSSWQEALDLFIDQCICGNTNLWDIMNTV